MLAPENSSTGANFLVRASPRCCGPPHASAPPRPAKQQTPGISVSGGGARVLRTSRSGYIPAPQGPETRTYLGPDGIQDQVIIRWPLVGGPLAATQPIEKFVSKPDLGLFPPGKPPIEVGGSFAPHLNLLLSLREGAAWTPGWSPTSGWGAAAPQTSLDRSE